MSAIWGAGGAILGVLVLGVISIVSGAPIQGLVMAGVGIFGGFGLIAGGAFGVALSALVRDESERIRALPMAGVGFITGAIGTLLIMLLISTGSTSIVALLRTTYPLMLGAGVTGSLFGAGIVRVANQDRPPQISSSKGNPKLPSGGV